ncbi:MAG TPA: plastocyanin/azurin family copper-binding protein, partial [Alphaproteobacteria bacterium]|nr:plastocyanin/azurin family copper-binding protein [Alphaproteobacteria bacterium]
LLLAGLVGNAPGLQAKPLPPVEIRMLSARDGTHVRFDPVGVLVAPGQTVRWVIEENVHTTTAYHPRNDNHALRIPMRAEPWDSGYLVNPGDHFEVTLSVRGVYDYFCRPHELAGMVGRIIVGHPADGPGSKPFDYFKGNAAGANWQPVPAAARRAFPPVEQIMRDKVVHV